MAFPLPEFIQLYPTIRCNQRCRFCFNSGSPYVPDLPFEKALALLDILAANAIKEIDIMGGEPLVLPWMPDFAGLAIKKGMTINISTNGSMPEAVMEFGDIDPGKCTIGISLEGSSAQSHNTITRSSHFEATVRSITSLLSLGLDPVVKTVIRRSTAPDLQSVIDLLKGIGAKRYYLIHMDLMTKNKLLLKEGIGYRDFEELYEQVRLANPEIGIFKVHASCFHKTRLPSGVRCAGGVRKLSVLPDGSVYPCNLFHRFNEFKLGNIFEESLPSLWENPKLRVFRKHRGNACREKNCTNRDLCTGGCPAHGYFHYGEVDGADIRCVLTL